MKKLPIFLIFFIFIAAIGSLKAQCNDELINVCHGTLPQDFKYLKSIPVKMKKSKKNEPPQTLKSNVVLNGGVKYLISACNAEEFEGQLVVCLYNEATMVGSTYDMKTGKDYKKFVYECKKSGVYNLVCYFLDGKEGCAVVLLSELQLKK